MRKLLFAVASAAGFIAGTQARAAVIDMTFDSLQTGESVDTYYDGGYGSLGSGPGPSYGITFANTIVVNQSQNNIAGLVSPPNAITFDSGSGAIMNVAGGFTGGFSFNYSAITVGSTISVWSGAYGSGTELASLTLSTTPNGSSNPNCDGKSYCPVEPASLTFSGLARSVDFGGTADFVIYDDITLGDPSSVPEPASMALLAGAIATLAAMRRRISA